MTRPNGGIRMNRAFAVLLAVLFLAVPAYSQQKRVLPAGTIDGSVHPEQIPDSVAYRLFFVQTALPTGAAADELARQKAQLARIGLNDVDRVALASALSIFYAENAAFLDKYSKGDPDGKAIATRDSITQETINRLHGLLSLDGQHALGQFIQQEKRAMTHVPTPAAN